MSEATGGAGGVALKIFLVAACALVDAGGDYVMRRDGGT